MDVSALIEGTLQMKSEGNDASVNYYRVTVLNTCKYP
jgi:hypothetical protein